MLLLSSFFLQVALFCFFYFLFPNFFSQIQLLEAKKISQFQKNLSQVYVMISYQKIKILFRSSLILAFLVWFFSPSFLLLLLLMGVFFVLPKAGISILQNQRKKKFFQQLPSALSSFSSILKAGQTFERALEVLTESQSPPISQEFQWMLNELQLGLSLSQSLQNLSKRFPDRDLEITVHAVSISTRMGTNLSEVLERVAETLRQRAKLRNRIKAITVQGRMQAWFATVLPLGLVFFLQIISPGYLDPLFQTSQGLGVLSFSGVLLLLGAFSIFQLCRPKKQW